ncbi:hypothetical protein JCM3766R1_006156 [Sporobolomyces carnicolor]
MERSRKRKIYYAEVDSDVDLNEDERRLDLTKSGTAHASKTRGGDTFGTANAKKRKTARRVNRNAASVTDADKSKLLSEIPFDVLAEVCSHVDAKDILSLAKVNRGLRRMLLSRGARSIWSSRRRALGLPLPDGMTELEFALATNSNVCEVYTGRVTHRTTAALLRVRLCQKCLKTHTISSTTLAKAWPSLHPQATQCVRYDYNRYLISDLQAVDHELEDLENHDDIDASLLEGLRGKNSSSRSRARPVHTIDGHGALRVDRVATFVMCKEKWVEVEQATARQLLEAQTKIDEEKKLAERAKEKRKEEGLEIFMACLRDSFGWASDEIRKLKDESYFQELAPNCPPEEDPAAWSELRICVQHQLRREARRKAQYARQEELSPYYRELKLERHNLEVFPTRYDFLRLRTVKSLWKPDDAVFNDGVWQEHLLQIFEDLDDFAAKSRIEAIRCILAANQGLSSTETLSQRPADFPESIYDRRFFSRATSLFVKIRRHQTLVASYFDLFQEEDQPFNSAVLERRMTRKISPAMRALLEAARLNPDKATIDDLDELEPKFIWSNDPRKTFRRRRPKLAWRQLLRVAIERGPSGRRIAQGERFKFVYLHDREDDDEEDAGENAERDGDENDDSDESDEEGARSAERADSAEQQENCSDGDEGI